MALLIYIYVFMYIFITLKNGSNAFAIITDLIGVLRLCGSCMYDTAVYVHYIHAPVQLFLTEFLSQMFSLMANTCIVYCQWLHILQLVH